jgi:hypothetical protein
MGRRDELELTSADLDADEVATRRLLAPFGEPAAAPPPPGLASRVLAALPAAAQPRPRRRLSPWLILVLGLLLAVGAWGVLGNSLGPAQAAGDPGEGIGQLVLVLTLAAKPLVNLFANLGLVAALLVLLGFGAALLWWRLLRATPLALPTEPLL